MLDRIRPYLSLPSDISSFEMAYLKRMNQIGALFFAAHIPIFMLVAWLNDTGVVLAGVLSAVVSAGPFIAARAVDTPRQQSMVLGFVAMSMGALLVHFGQGPMQIEMHFYFFALIAMLAIFANPMVVLVAAATVTCHHVLFWALLPESIFNYDASFLVVLVHAAFVVFDSVIACFISRNFFDNVVGLEKIIEQRTEALNGRNEDMRRLLNSVDQGFLTIDLQAQVSAERSAIVETWTGPIQSGATFGELLGRLDAQAQEWFELGWEDIVDDFMPVELSLSQLPARIVHEGRYLAISYSPLFGDDEELARVLVVISDVTATVAAERLEAEGRELVVVFEKILSDKAGFLEFYTDADDLITAICEGSYPDTAVARRWIHTVKGNAAIFGLTSFSRSCHELESRIDETGEGLTSVEREALLVHWTKVRANLKRLLGEEQKATIVIDDEEYRHILNMLLTKSPRTLIAQRIAAWKLEPTEKRLNRIANQTRALACRLAKPGVSVAIEHHGLLLAPKPWSPFWSSFIHVIRNAIDHGIETPEERTEAGKAGGGTVTLRTLVEGGEFIVEVADDGRGIDWDKIRTKASSLGLPATETSDLVEALFSDGVSSRDEVSETSGRGVGMSAVRQACLERGGRVEVQTTLGEGTRFRFCFPEDLLKPLQAVA